MPWLKLTAVLALRSLRHPSLAAALVRTGWRFRSRHWYRTPPFLPVPDRAYVRWRMYTAYGNADTVPPPDDVARYARWAR